jgi:hypothetical protein
MTWDCGRRRIENSTRDRRTPPRVRVFMGRRALAEVAFVAIAVIVAGRVALADGICDGGDLETEPTPASAGVKLRKFLCAVGESRTPTIVRSPEPESENAR